MWNFTFLFQAVPTNNREHDTEGRPGEDIILLCSEDGDPLEATRWIRNGVSIVPGPKYALQGNRLTIRQATRSDFGRYECFPENTLGFARNVVNLGFRGSFLQKYCFLQLIALLSKYLGNFTSLTCRQENTQSFLLWNVHVILTNIFLIHIQIHIWLLVLFHFQRDKSRPIIRATLLWIQPFSRPPIKWIRPSTKQSRISSTRIEHTLSKTWSPSSAIRLLMPSS